MSQGGLGRAPKLPVTFVCCTHFVPPLQPSSGGPPSPPARFLSARF